MTSNTLTERYVREVVRRIPAGQRDDVADELRTTIADTVEARGPGPGPAEREVLVEMGDPIRLAARYADRPLYLIGPELYPAYVRLLVVLLSTVLPLVTAVLVVIDVFENDDLGSAIGSGIAALFGVGAQMIAWVTVGFALIERSRHRADVAASTDTWAPEDLPELRPSDNAGRGACAAALWDALLIALILWQQTAKPYRGDGERLRVLDPDLWSGWIWPILAGLAASVVLELVRIARHGWTLALVSMYAVAQAVFAIPLAWILYDQKFFNPEFLAEVSGGWTPPDGLYTLSALVVLGVAVFEVTARLREARSQTS